MNRLTSLLKFVREFKIVFYVQRKICSWRHKNISIGWWNLILTEDLSSVAIDRPSIIALILSTNGLVKYTRHLSCESGDAVEVQLVQLLCFKIFCYLQTVVVVVKQYILLQRAFVSWFSRPRYTPSLHMYNGMILLAWMKWDEDEVAGENLVLERKLFERCIKRSISEYGVIEWFNLRLLTANNFCVVITEIKTGNVSFCITAFWAMLSFTWLNISGFNIS